MTGTRDTRTPTPHPIGLDRDEVTSRSLRDTRDPRRPRSAVAPLPPPPARRARFDETPTAVERPPVELSRPEEDELQLDRPLFGGNTDVVDAEEYERLVSSSSEEEEEPELEFDQAPTPISSPPALPRPRDPVPQLPDLPLAAFARSEATVELVFGGAQPARSELTPLPPPRARVATPCAIGVATDRGLPAIPEPRRERRVLLLALLLAGGALIVLGLVTLAVFLVARTPTPAAVIARPAATPVRLPKPPAPHSPRVAAKPGPSPAAATQGPAAAPLTPERPDPLLEEAALLERRGARGQAARLRLQSAIRRGEWSEAERRWRALPHGLRSDLDAVLWRAEIATHRRRFGTAESIYRWLVRSKRARGAQAVRVELGLGDVLLARGRPREACSHVRRAEAGARALEESELRVRVARRLERCGAF